MANAAAKSATSSAKNPKVAAKDATDKIVRDIIGKAK